MNVTVQKMSTNTAEIYKCCCIHLAVEVVANALLMSDVPRRCQYASVCNSSGNKNTQAPGNFFELKCFWAKRSTGTRKSQKKSAKSAGRC